MEYSYVPEINANDFFEHIQEKGRSSRTPILGSIDLTFRCNLRCVHCCVVQNPNRKELSTNEIHRILDEITQEGCLRLMFSGGEPLIHKDFLDIYTYAMEKGLLISIFTNGTLITPQIADYFYELPPYSVEVSLYGITEETYERVTGVPGSFEHCIKGIHLLHDRGIPLLLKTVAMTINQHEISDMMQYAEKLGVKFDFDSLIYPKFNGSKEPCKYRLSPEEVVKLDLLDKKRLQKSKEYWRKLWGLVISDYLYICDTGGITSFRISPYGKLMICGLSRTPSYDLHRGSFKDGWNNFIPKIREQKRKNIDKCRTCEMARICGVCPGWSQLENGNPESPVEYLCKITNLAARTYGVKKSLQEKKRGGE